ncbi:DIP1281 family NlpC/P60 protein [Corynebacterium timonense]|uniref:Cell wall-associated hydrolase, NlpC family n=1 Tax=Corynebacterium timonense TaxID=441500 RepID=A0A1H1P3W6_9CORY|nr:NlpC/P60 family protein [Corynebacterium timonense]SDS05309.1 Cell wall-associated hydrolase, NlpC family [Corynebacterium timonense]
MGSTPLGTGLRWARTAVSVVTCSTILSLTASPSASSQPAGSSASELVAAIAQAQSRVDALDLRMGGLRENVNRALVELHDAQLRAEQARRGVEEARSRLNQSEDAVVSARTELSEVTRSLYRAQGGPSVLAGLNSDDHAKDALDRASFLRSQREEKQEQLTEVERARTVAANEESTLREASNYAEEAANDAVAAETAARAVLEESQQELEAQLAERQAAHDELVSVQAQLDAVRPSAARPAEDEEAVPDTTVPDTAAPDTTAPSTASTETQETETRETRADEPAEQPGTAETEPEAPDEAGSHPALVQPQPPAPAAGVAGTPYAASQDDIDAVRDEVSSSFPGTPELSDTVISSALSTAQQAAQRAGETLSDPTIQAAAIAAASALVASSQAPHDTLDNPYTANGSSAGAGELVAAFSRGLTDVLEGRVATASPAVEEVLPEVDSAATATEKITGTVPVGNGVETVIARAMSMIGTPYVWGGGDANGPTTGVNGGSQLGFDCSGLVLYAFAGVGISLPHYTGDQYRRGTQIDPSEARRGDLLFWGPNGNQHVAIYLGDGTMIEAPTFGQTVTISPVRYGGMSAKAVRLL